MTTESVRYTRNLDFIYRKIVDESVLVPIHQDVANMDSIFTLNGVGAFVWERLENPATRAELEAALLAEYDVDTTVLVSDLELFLSDMTAIGALRKE